MNGTFSQEVSTILLYSREEARRTASTHVRPEHLLLAMLRHKTCVIHQVLAHFCVNEGEFRQGIDQRLTPSDTTSTIPQADVQLDDAATNILMRSALEARKQHAAVIDSSHLLLAILHDTADNTAKVALNAFNISYDSVFAMIATAPNATEDMMGLPDEDEEDDDDEPFDNGNATQNTTTSKKAKDKSTTPILDNFSVDLTQAARDKKLDPVVGRERHIQRIIEILCRRKKNNPVIIGEPGVGKSAIVEGLAQLIVKQETSPLLYNKRLVSLDLTAIVAGTKYRGQFEERIKALIKEIEEQPDIIVFIDEIHTIIGAGSTPGSMDAANILKPALARGTIQCIGATTLDEYRNSIEKDGALERRFQKVIVQPTDKEETLNILQNIKSYYEDYHHVTYSDEAIEACVTLTERYVTDRAFPDKAIDALDEAGSMIHIKTTHLPDDIKQLNQQLEEARNNKIAAVNRQEFEEAAAFRDKQQQLQQQIDLRNEEWNSGNETPRPTVTYADVAEVLSTMTGVPLQRIEQSEGEKLRSMADILKHYVVAQDKAVDVLVRSIQRNRVGLRTHNRPIGVFMFLGPTGVGKTYLAKQLAKHMFGSDDDIIRIDMSEYTESFNVSRLIGAPPGYVGYEEGGQLTERVRRKPYAIILLDEIEKAHSTIYNLLLQVLDEGRLTDGNGRIVDFRNTIIIMTSNTGTRQLKEFGHGIGFSNVNSQDITQADKEYARKVITKSLNKQFPPEFLNRIDEIITFEQLDKQAIRQIVDIETDKLIRQINEIGWNVEVSSRARDFLADQGYDVQFGARPLKRALQQYVEDVVCQYILNNKDQKKDADLCLVIDKTKNKNELNIKEKLSAMPHSEEETE